MVLIEKYRKVHARDEVGLGIPMMSGTDSEGNRPGVFSTLTGWLPPETLFLFVLSWEGYVFRTSCWPAGQHPQWLLRDDDHPSRSNGLLGVLFMSDFSLGSRYKEQASFRAFRNIVVGDNLDVRGGSDKPLTIQFVRKRRRSTDNH